MSNLPKNFCVNVTIKRDSDPALTTEEIRNIGDRVVDFLKEVSVDLSPCGDVRLKIDVKVYGPKDKDKSDET